MIRKFFAFITRDLQLLSSYRFAMLTNYIQLVMNLFLFIFIARIFGSRMTESLKMYGGDFISYIIIGSIGWGYLWSAMNASSIAIRNEISMGTFEPIYLTRTSPFLIIITYTVASLIIATFPMIILLTIGFIFFKIQLYGNQIIAFLILLISVIMMVGFGLIAAGLSIFLKKIGSLLSIIKSASLFFCGIYFPISLLPEFIKPLSYFLPFYYSIKGIRIALSPKPDMKILTNYILILGLFSCFSIAIGIYSVKKGIKKARKEGTLMYY